VKGVPDPPANKKPQKQRKFTVVQMLSAAAAVVLLLTLGIIFAALGILGFFSGTGGNVTVPSLVNMQFTAAQSSVGTKWVITKDTSLNSDTVPAGAIISQNPEAGTSAKPNTNIKVVVSLGQKMAKVPKEDGNATQDATTELTNAGFLVVSQPKSDPSMAKDHVISTDPAGDTQAAYGSTVTIYYSTGPAITTATAPDLSKSTKDTVQHDIEAAQFKLGTITYKFDSNSTASNDTFNKVIYQSLASGSTQTAGLPINVTISSGALPNISAGNVLDTAYNKVKSSNGHLAITINDDLTGNALASSNYSNYIVVDFSSNATDRTFTITAVKKFADYLTPSNKTVQSIQRAIAQDEYTNILVVSNANPSGVPYDASMDTYHVTSIGGSANSTNNSLYNTGVRKTDPIYLITGN
jgi:beta-lactam-binding protein with PASTA domain